MLAKFFSVFDIALGSSLVKLLSGLPRTLKTKTKNKRSRKREAKRRRHCQKMKALTKKRAQKKMKNARRNSPLTHNPRMKDILKSPSTHRPRKHLLFRTLTKQKPLSTYRSPRPI